jgi:hypothetical protein
MLDVRSFKGDEYDIDHFPVAAEFRERLSVSKQVSQNPDVERFNHGKLNDLEVTEQHHIKF